MKKKNLKWTIEDLMKRYKNIEFPEFQREPNVWNLDKKRKLIDSILRKFDIANIYLYKREDGNYECIDGRQRINAILSFVGLYEGKQEEGNSNQYNNYFKFISSDELLGGDLLKNYTNKTYQEFSSNQKENLKQYEFNIIEITQISEEEDELNLMFLRLQLGVPLNAGEKLNAMLGDMRNMVFNKLSKRKYFTFLNIPKRRFSKELTASQIAINFFSIQASNHFERARFIDLQEFFKNHLKFTKDDKETTELLNKRLIDVYNYINKEKAINLKNRAIGITVFFFINSMIEGNNINQIKKFIKFLNEFLKRLKSQIAKGIDIETRYRDLLKFQTYVSQAAVEKYAIENRQKFLEEYFKYYLDSGGKIKGDK